MSFKQSEIRVLKLKCIKCQVITVQSCLVLIVSFQLHHEQISSLASEELQSFRNAELSSQKAEDPQEEQLCIPPAPAQPPPPPPPQLSTATFKFSATTTGDPGEARRALMEAICSGAGAAKLKKVNILLYFLVDEITWSWSALGAVCKLFQPRISFCHQKSGAFSVFSRRLRVFFKPLNRY